MPHPANCSTRGEARAFAALADQEGWRSVVVVVTGTVQRSC
jgi:hypothetical protein